MDLTDLVQDKDRGQAFMNAVMNLQVPYNAGNFLTSRNPLRFSKTLLPGFS